jgi:hypothetical protein
MGRLKIGLMAGVSALVALAALASVPRSSSIADVAPTASTGLESAPPSEASSALATSPFSMASSAPSVVRLPSSLRAFAPPAQDDPCYNADGITRYGYIDRPEPNPHLNFYFTRAAYTEGMYSRGSSWAVDFPKADRQFLYVMERTLGWNIFPCENPISLADENLRRFPFIYLLEVGQMSLSPLERENFRNFLLAGGFAYIDDFWDVNEWANFEREIREVLPEYDIVDVPLDHMIFHIIYPIEQVLQIPNINNGSTNNPAYYGECRGDCPASVKGIFNEDGRLMVVMTHNSDLGDAWEWAEVPEYPYERSNYAFSFAFNIIAYAMVY